MVAKNTRRNGRSPRRISVPPELRKLYGDRLITRAVAAHILGISKSELCLRDKDKIYPFITDSQGRKWYDEDTICNLPPEARAGVVRVQQAKFDKVSSTTKYSGEVAAIVFDELNQGHALDVIVVTRGVHPEAALSIQDAYARVKGGLYLSKEVLESLGRLPFKATAWPPKKGEDLVTVLETILKAQSCVRCKTKAAKVCPSCVDEIATGSVKLAVQDTANGLR